MNRKKVFYILVILGVLTSISAFVGINNVAPYAIIMPPKINLDKTPSDLGLTSKELVIKTHDDFNLQGYQIESNQVVTKGVIILIHGIGGCKEHFLDLANKLSNKGLMTIIFDGRAHGESEGKYCTYGFYEKRDVSKIVDLIKSQNPNLPIGVWGNSLGGAIAIQALEYDKRINFGIIESTFAELDQITFDYMKRILKGVGTKDISNYALEKAGEIADFNPNDVKPIKSVTNVEQPVLIAHGDADKNISYRYGQELYDNLKSEHKKFVLVKDGGHFGLFETGEIDYENQIMTFIDQNLSEVHSEVSINVFDNK